MICRRFVRAESECNQRAKLQFNSIQFIYLRPRWSSLAIKNAVYRKDVLNLTTYFEIIFSSHFAALENYLSICSKRPLTITNEMGIAVEAPFLSAAA